MFFFIYIKSSLLLKYAVVLTHVLLNPLRYKFYVRTRMLTQKGQEKLLASDSK